MRKLASLKYLKEKAWSLQSKAIRLSESDNEGYCICYTCGKRRPYEEMHIGHYIHNKLDFDSRNLKVQCPHCNLYLSGNLGLYAERLVNENGSEWLKQLRLDAFKKGNNYKRPEIMEIISRYGKPKSN